MAQLDYISIDTDFFDKPKIKAFIYRNGQECVSFLLRLLCSMGRASDGTISRDAWEAIGLEAGLNTERATKLVTYCLQNQILTGELDRLGNTRVSEDREALDVKRAKVRERVSAYRAKRKDDGGKVDGPHVPSPVVMLQPPVMERRQVRESVEEEKFDTTDPNLQIALEKLERPEGQPWTNDNRYMAAGRRPMRDYPALWLTPFELADVVKKLEASQIPMSSYKDLFLKAEARLKTYSSQGRSNQSVSVYNWLTGFLFDELLERTIKETRLARTMEVPTKYEQRR